MFKKKESRHGSLQPSFRLRSFRLNFFLSPSLQFPRSKRMLTVLVFPVRMVRTKYERKHFFLHCVCINILLDSLLDCFFAQKYIVSSIVSFVYITYYIYISLVWYNFCFFVARV